MSKPTFTLAPAGISDLKRVYVYPDGEQFDVTPDWKSDDYEVRQTALCYRCDEELQVIYGMDSATCKCGTRLWYK